MINNSLNILGPIKKKMSLKDITSIHNIIKSENKGTIVSKIDFLLFLEFINIICKSKKLFLFLLKSKKKIIGYSIYSTKSKYLISEMKPLRFRIIFNLIKQFYFFNIFNLIVKSMISINLFNNKKKNKLNKIFNLSYLAIQKNFQSKGYGEFFIKKINMYLKKKYNLKHLFTEAKNPKTVNFYLRKCKFKLYYYKIELFKVHKILIKKI